MNACVRVSQTVTIAVMLSCRAVGGERPGVSSETHNNRSNETSHMCSARPHPETCSLNEQNFKVVFLDG